MPIEHTTRAITENKYIMQIFADTKSLEADIAMLKKLRQANPSDERASDYIIKQKEYELSQIEGRLKGRDYSSVKVQCEKYFLDNLTLFDKDTIIAETRSMLSRGQTVNEWPHLAAVFLIDHAIVIEKARQQLADTKPDAGTVNLGESLKPDEQLVPPDPKAQPPVRTPETDTQKPLTQKGNTPKRGTPKPAGKDIPEDVPEILTTQQKVIFKDGRYYLTGPKGNTRRVEVSELLVNLKLAPNAPENLQKSVRVVEDFSLVLYAFIAANPKDTAKYEAAVKTVQGLFAHEDVQTGKKILDVTSITTGMFDNFWRTTSDTDLKKINDAFRMEDDTARRLAILNFIRNVLGQSDIVLAKILESRSSYFEFPKDEDILNGKLTGISGNTLKKVTETIDSARGEANSNWIKNKAQYIAAFTQQNPGKTIDPELARQWNEKLTILALAKREIMYQKLYNKDLTGDLALAQDIMGASTFDVSDKAWDVSTEIGGMIAMEAIAIGAGLVTAGVATAAINAAMLGRNAYRGAKAIEAYNAVSKTKKILTTSARIIGGGVAFEAGGATTRSLIENGDLTSMHSKEGYVQSIAMIGVMRGLGHVFEKTGVLAFKNGTGIAKNIVPFTGQVAIEGAAIFGTSAAIGSVLFDRRDNWTLEQMAQAMLMAAIFKGAGRITAGKNSKGEPEVKADFITDSKNNTKIVGHKTVPDAPTGSSNNFGRYILDGKEYRWSPKQEAFLGKNGERYTKEQFEKLQAQKAPKIEYKTENKENPAVVDTKVQPKDNTSEAVATSKNETKVEPVKSKENSTGKTKEQQATVSSEGLTRQATNPHAAKAAVESVSHSSKKMGETFSTEWLKIISNATGKSIKWLADQSVGPVFRILTGNNPSALLSLANPSGWTGKASKYGNNLLEHWKSPVRNSINLLVTGERKDGQGAISAIAKNVIFAGGITALDYFAVPNEQANTPGNMAQNYYEMILFGWLGLVLMERGPIIEGAKDAKDWVSDRIQAKPF